MAAKEIVNAIIAGESSKLPDLFDDAIQPKVETALEDMKVRVTRDMFNSKEE